MGHIKEPKGVDFVIASDPLTDNAKQEISEFIAHYKSKVKNKRASSERAKKHTKAGVSQS